MRHLSGLSRLVLLSLVLVHMAVLMYSTQAHAQPNTPNPCAVPEPNIPIYYTDLMHSAQLRFNCMPAPGGPGTGLTIRSNAHGVMAWWWCPESAAQKPPYGGPNFAAATWLRLLSGNLTPDTPLADPMLTPVWCPFQEEMHASKPKPAPTMVTAGTTTYRTTAGALSGFAGIGTKGVACDCTKAIRVGTATYCTFTGASSPNIVAQCVAAAPP